MTFYKIFLKKELIEMWRTKKILILLVASIFLGLSAPLFTKMLPDLLKSSTNEGIQITVNETTKFDSWSQFFKNINQMGIIIIIIVFSDIFAKEIQTGTIINILTKGVSRKSIICSIYTVVMTFWTLLLILSMSICHFYTVYYWGAIDIEKILFTFSMTWMYGIVLLSILLLGQIIFKSIFGGLGCAGGFYIFLLIIGMFPKTKKYSTSNLQNGMEYIIGKTEMSDYFITFIISICLIVVSFISALKIFDKSNLYV